MLRVASEVRPTVSGTRGAIFVAEMYEVTLATVPCIDKVGQHLRMEVALEPAVLAATSPVTASALVVAIAATYVGKAGAVPQGCAVYGSRCMAPWARYAVVL